MDLSFDATISFLAPLNIPFVNNSLWTGEVGTWFFFDGSLDIYGYEISTAFDIMLDTQYQSNILWNHNDNRFILKIPEILNENMEVQLETIEDISDLSVYITTEEGTWNCILAETSCEGPNNQVLDW